MAVIFVTGLAVAYAAEATGTPALSALGLEGGNMEGKAGAIRHRALGPVRGDHDRGVVRRGQRDARQLPALSGMIPLINMELGEIVVADSRGIPDFGLLHADLATGRKDRLLYYVFDLTTCATAAARRPSAPDRRGRGRDSQSRSR